MNPVLYIIMRNDLNSLNPGKAVAQGAHAANQFQSHIESIDKPSNKNIIMLYENWKSQAFQFGTTIVLQGSEFEIASINEEALIVNDVVYGKVIDPTYPFTVNAEIMSLLGAAGIIGESKIIDKNTVHCVREEMTCFYIFGNKDNTQLQKLLENLKLMD